eukprot:scaffold3178_cov282-Pinguiococcus_pyrenoidosus.AAC.4
MLEGNALPDFEAQRRPGDPQYPAQRHPPELRRRTRQELRCGGLSEWSAGSGLSELVPPLIHGPVMKGSANIQQALAWPATVCAPLAADALSNPHETWRF